MQGYRRKMRAVPDPEGPAGGVLPAIRESLMQPVNSHLVGKPRGGDGNTAELVTSNLLVKRGDDRGIVRVYPGDVNRPKVKGSCGGDTPPTQGPY